MSAADPPASRDLVDYERAYAESGFEVVQAAFRKRMLLSLLERLRPGRVLEVGCGADSLANHWQGWTQFTIVEPAPDFAAKARRDTAGFDGIEVVEGMLETVAPDLVGDRVDFDLILLSGLLHELTDCDALMTCVADLCGPRTVVHVNVPNARSMHRLLALEMEIIDELTTLSPLQKTLQQQRTFTSESLTAYVESQGFTVLDHGSYFIKPFTHAQMQQLLEAGILTQAMLEGFWGLEKHMPGLGSEIFVNLRLARDDP